jgi:hypothetical protein
MGTPEAMAADMTVDTAADTIRDTAADTAVDTAGDTAGDTVVTLGTAATATMDMADIMVNSVIITVVSK